MLKNRIKISIALGALVAIAAVCASCSYNFGYAQRTLPGGYKQVAVPVFQNKTKEVGMERYFTDSLVREFNRSQVAQVVDRGVAPVVIEGTIKSMTVSPSSLISANSDSNIISLPANTVLAAEYSIVIVANVALRRMSDQKVLWQGSFTSEQVYQAPQVGVGTLNTVDPLYDHSAHKTVVEQLAKDMMNDAHDRMTENF